MPTHFNPPPGWPVPDGWTPPEDWEPDPSWPAAPAGWQFWADDAPDPLTATVRREPYRPAGSGAGPVGWGASGDPTNFAYGAEFDAGIEPQDRQSRRPSTSNDRIVLASVAGALIAALILVGVVIVVFTHHPNSSAADKASDTHSSGTQWTSVPPAPGAPAGKSGNNARPQGDLGLSTPISFPQCDGQGVVILGSLVEPSRYATGVQLLLDAHPGAAYLRTDLSCRSLRPRSDQGTLIYAVYTLAGPSQAQLCAAVQAAGDGAYGKWLDETTDPDYIVPC